MEVAPRVSPVMLLVRSSAATDPQMRELWDQMADQRREPHGPQRRPACWRRDRCATELSRDDVRDVLYTYTSPELYEILVLEAGWSLQAYADFIHRGLRGQLLQAGSDELVGQPA